MAKSRIQFLPHQKSGSFESGTVIRDAALDLGILIDSSCAGIGTCGKCKVEVRSGAADPTPVEEAVLSATELEKGVRLSCQAQLSTDAVCYVPEHSLAVVDQIASWGVDGRFDLDPEVVAVPSSYPKIGLGDRQFSFDLFRDQLANAGHPINDDVDHMRQFAKDFRPGAHDTQVVVDRENLIAFVSADSQILGLAVDIGTTTLAVKVVNLQSGETLGVASAANPQSALGSDVVARIQYIARHSGGLRKMQRLVVNQLNELVQGICAQIDVRRQDILKTVVVGNTIMQHILLGISPASMGTSPYTAIARGPVRLRAEELGLDVNRRGMVYVAPNLASFVGGDITSVLTATRMDLRSDLTLVIDMGTNGEIVLGDADRMICCSSPAGPAWEGACITWGMRAANGAIERAEIVDNELLFRTIGGAPPVGICGSGLIDLVCAFLRAGLIQMSGRIPIPDEIRDELHPRLVERIQTLQTGKRALKITEINGSESVLVTQDDIRQIQLAKAGIAAGVKTLMNTLEVSGEDVARVFLAGAFGNHVQAADVAQLGLVPGVATNRIHFVGNAALSGCESMLRSTQAVRLAEKIASRIEYVEVAGKPGFEDLFVECIPFAPPSQNAIRS